MITLKLWIENQVGVDTDCTDAYIRAAHWHPPAGVTLDAAASTLSGEDAEAVWAAYRSLAASVANAGHGLDDPEDELAAEEAAGAPSLTAITA